VGGDRVKLGGDAGVCGKDDRGTMVPILIEEVVSGVTTDLVEVSEIPMPMPDGD